MKSLIFIYTHNAKKHHPRKQFKYKDLKKHTLKTVLCFSKINKSIKNLDKEKKFRRIIWSFLFLFFSVLKSKRF